MIEMPGRAIKYDSHCSLSRQNSATKAQTKQAKKMNKKDNLGNF
jgi:hypothetical protein